MTSLILTALLTTTGTGYMHLEGTTNSLFDYRSEVHVYPAISVIQDTKSNAVTTVHIPVKSVRRIEFAGDELRIEVQDAEAKGR